MPSLSSQREQVRVNGVLVVPLRGDMAHEPLRGG